MTTLKLSKWAKKQISKKQLPEDPMQRLLVEISIAIGGEIDEANLIATTMNLIDMCDGDVERAIAAVKNKEIMFGGDGGHDGYRYVSYEDLAKELGCAPGEVRDSLDRLSELGYLRVRSRDENGAVLMPNWFGYPKK